MKDTRCGICVGLWSPFPCPHDQDAQMCVCGHHSHNHASDPAGSGDTPCWYSLNGGTDSHDYPINRCPCREYNPAVS